MVNRIYVDMDGTLARFHEHKNFAQEMYCEDFFRNLRPYHEVCQAINELAEETDTDLYILSSAATCRSNIPHQKREWIKEHLPSVKPENIVILPLDIPKSSVLHTGDILLDDYNKNLRDWVAHGGRAIKLVNEINDHGITSPRWRGSRIRYDSSPEEIKTRLIEKIREVS